MSTKKSVSSGKSQTKNSRKTVTKRGPSQKKNKKAPKKKNPIKGSTPWKPGQSGNPKGRPKKLLKSIMDELKKQGHAPVSPANVREAFEIILGLSTDKLAEYSQDADVPVLLRICATSLQDKAKRFEVLDKMLDRAHGKAKQSSQVILEDNTTPDLSGLSFSELYMLKYGKKPRK